MASNPIWTPQTIMSLSLMTKPNPKLELSENLTTSLPIALRKAKIAYNFSLSECNRVNVLVYWDT